MGKVKGLFFATLAAVATFFATSYLFVPRLASRGEALAVLISYTVLALLQFFTMRRDLDLSARGILGRAKDARRFVASRSKSTQGKKELKN